MKTETLYTKRLKLTSITDKDKDDLIEIASDPMVYKSYMIPDLLTDDAKDKFFLRLKNATLSSEKICYGIYLKDKLIGFINEVERFNDNKSIEVGYFLKEKEWNKGYATEALSIMIKELFIQGFEEVEAAHFDFNIASGKVMMKCGMKQIEKDCMVEYRGNNYKGIYYSIKK